MSILDELDIYDEKKNGEYQNFNENDEKKKVVIVRISIMGALILLKMILKNL
ncbi:hypothetical protein [Fusobacterium animalis]|uniref:hypothetical protein n=1 Tax=Fusobacterium animalis TaxID=76859 RepID=UPI0030D3411C